MYLIALCDDEAAELDKTEWMLKSYGKSHTRAEFSIERFGSADELLEKVRDKKYMPDIILMDIYMPVKLGIDAAYELRSMGSNGRIVFLTTSREHALDAFGVEASQYLVKPVSEKTLFPVLDRILGDMDEARRKYLLLRIDGKIQRVAVNEIVYCEAEERRSICICQMVSSTGFAARWPRSMRCSPVIGNSRGWGLPTS